MKGLSLDGRRWAAVAAVALATVLGGALRFEGLGTPGLWLDEILHYDVATWAARLPWYRWVLGFEFENGPLFYGSLLAGRAVAVDDAAAADRLAAALAGTVAIPLVAVAGTLAGGATVGVAAAWLLAAAPFHVFYSREGRPYALLALLSAILLIALLSRGQRLSARLGWGVALAAPYLAVSSFQLFAGTLLAAGACGLAGRGGGERTGKARLRDPGAPQEGAWTDRAAAEPASAKVAGEGTARNEGPEVPLLHINPEIPSVHGDPAVPLAQPGRAWRQLIRRSHR